MHFRRNPSSIHFLAGSFQESALLLPCPCLFDFLCFFCVTVLDCCFLPCCATSGWPTPCLKPSFLSRPHFFLSWLVRACCLFCLTVFPLPFLPLPRAIFPLVLRLATPRALGLVRSLTSCLFRVFYGFFSRAFYLNQRLKHSPVWGSL